MKKLLKESWHFLKKNIRTGKIEHLGEYSSRIQGVQYAPEGLDDWLETAGCSDIDQRDDLIADFIQYGGKKSIQFKNNVFFLSKTNPKHGEDIEVPEVVHFNQTKLTNEGANMKKLNITKKQYAESKYFTKKYGTLKYVSESGKLFKTSKGKVLKFNESESIDPELRMRALDAQRKLGQLAFLTDDEMRIKQRRFRTMKDIRRQQLADAMDDIMEYRAASKALTNDRRSGKFAGVASMNESIDDDMDEIDGELEELSKEYYKPVLRGLEALREFNIKAEPYAPTCQYEIDQAIENLETVVTWLKQGATGGFYTEGVDDETCRGRCPNCRSMIEFDPNDDTTFCTTCQEEINLDDITNISCDE